MKQYLDKYTVHKEGFVVSHYSGKRLTISEYKKNKQGKQVVYPRVRLCISGKGKWVALHRLIAECFIPNPENLPHINHKDGNRLNNHVDNLEWCTGKHNSKHSYELGLKVYNFPTLGKKLPKRGNGKETKYFGICNPANRNYWVVRVQHQSKVVIRGCFKTEIEAAKYYDEQVKLLGLNRPLNFPDH